MIIGDRVGLCYRFGFGMVRQPSEASAAFVPPVSIEDHPLLWMVVKSQTYYPEHILAYESGKARYALVVGFSSF